MDEIKEASKTFKNNKSFGTDNVPTEGVKYSLSNKLFVYLTMNFSYIDLDVPKSWLELKIIFLYKKGLKSLAEKLSRIFYWFKPE